jgi:hypothetical protein
MAVDVVQGDFTFDLRSGAVTGVQPGRRQYLDPEISGEGTKVIHSDGSVVHFNPPPVKAAIFDYSQVKILQKYFNRTDFHFFPTWVYHPDGREETAKDAQECGDKYGIFLVKRSAEEKAKFGGGDYRWEFSDTTEWRPVRVVPKKFDPENPDTGKIYVPRAPDPKIANHELIERVVAAMQGGQNDFLLKLLSAMQNTTSNAAVPAPEEAKEPEASAVELGSQKSAKEHWQAVAEEAGVEIDKRWGIDRIKTEIAEKTRNVALMPEETTEDVE